MDEDEQFLKCEDIRKTIKVCPSTLRRWANEGKVKTIRSVGGQRLYDINSIIKEKNSYFDKQNKREKICYCRVSSNKQAPDLKRQEEFMQSKFPNYTIISDIGSGINWKRTNFSKLLEKVINGKVEEIVIAHKDRLCRFNFELLESIFKICKVTFTVLDRESFKSEEQELAEDLLAIVHIFNCRQMGRRRYKCSSDVEIKENKNLSNK